MTTQVKDLHMASRIARERVIGGTTFDWMMIGACTWLMTGGYLDAWAHNHFALDTFFTPWHGILYSGFLVVALTLIGTIIYNHLHGKSWREAIPAGYELSVMAVCGFAIGGVADMFWHILFGIEVNIDAQLSPSHLLLMVCWGLICAGPFRSLWRRANTSIRSDRWSQLALPCALLLFLSVFSLITQTNHPFTLLAPTDVVKTQQLAQSFAVIGIVFQSIILMILFLLAIRRWKMPTGSFMLVMTINAAALSLMHNTYIVIPIALVAGVLIDIAYRLLKPSRTRIYEFRLFASIVPPIVYTMYFLFLWVTMGIVWSVHLSVGSIVVSGITGWLISYALIPPAEPDEKTSHS